mgnify:CR=1 FL=1
MGCPTFTSGLNAECIKDGSWPANYCFTDWDTFFEDIKQYLIVTLPGGFSTFVTGETTPDANDRDKLWFRRTDGGSGGCVVDILLWNGSTWVKAIRHPLAPGHISFYYNASFTGTHAENKAKISFIDIIEASYDTDNPEDLHTNPYWLLCDGIEVVGPAWGPFTPPDILGRMLLGAGQGTDLTNRTMGDDGGEEDHELTVGELAEHTHDVKVGTGSATTAITSGSSGSTTTDIADAAIAEGGGNAHNNMPPFFCAYPIIRTPRL